MCVCKITLWTVIACYILSATKVQILINTNLETFVVIGSFNKLKHEYKYVRKITGQKSPLIAILWTYG